VLRALVPNVETLGYYRMSLRDKDLARKFNPQDMRTTDEWVQELREGEKP
jgi:hypothetical protein